MNQPPPWDPRGQQPDPGEQYGPSGAQPPQDPRPPQPGWYTDPGGSRVLRWWDGTAWTPHTQPLPDLQPPTGTQPGTAPPAAGPAPQPAGHRSQRSGNSRWVRNIFAVIGALVVAGAIISFLSGGGSTGSSTSPGQAAVAGSASAPASGSPPPPASPTPPSPTKVEFIVSGSAPDGIQITYGPGGTQLSGPSVLGGTATMSMSFDANASYYALSAQLQGDGDITCKIVATGPGDQPLTVSHGAASGGYNICSAQAAPSNNGLNWQDEN